MNDDARRELNSHPGDDLAAYALGALEPAEAAEVERHVEECERCRAELRWLQPAVDVLPSSVPQLEAPAGLRRELMRTVRAEAREERGGWWARRPGWITLRARPAVVLAAVALLGAGIAGYIVNEANQVGQETVTQFQAKGTGDAVLTRSDGEAVLHVERLPALKSGRVYQLWVEDGDGVHPYPTFTLDAEGQATANVGAVPDDAKAVLVTDEPEGGSEQPTTKPVLKAPLS